MRSSNGTTAARPDAEKVEAVSAAFARKDELIRGRFRGGK